MVNMSYCMFRNTLMALQEIVDSVQDPEDIDEEFAEELSPEEADAKRELLELCRWVAENGFDDEN